MGRRLGGVDLTCLAVRQRRSGVQVLPFGRLGMVRCPATSACSGPGPRRCCLPRALLFCVAGQAAEAQVRSMKAIVKDGSPLC